MSSEKPATLRDINRAKDTNNTPPSKSQVRNALTKTPPKRDGKENVQLPDCDAAPTPSPIRSSCTYDRWCRLRSENQYLFLLAVKENGGEPALRRAIQDLDAAAFEAAVTFAMPCPHARPDEASSYERIEADTTNVWSKTESLSGAQLAGGYSDISAQADIEAAADDEAPAAASSAAELHDPSPEAKLVTVSSLESTVDDTLVDDAGRIELYESQQGDHPAYLLHAPEVPSPATRTFHTAVLREVARRIKEQPHEDEVIKRDDWIEKVWMPSNRDARERAAQQALHAGHNDKDTTGDSSDDDVFC